MRKTAFCCIILLGLLAIIAATGCGTRDTAVSAQEIESDTPSGVEVAQATEAVTEPATMTDVTDTRIVDVPTLIPTQDTACIDCHNDAELLAELAVEKEVPEVPSEGSG